MMLKIRPEQIAALDRSVEKTFIRRLADYLAVEYSTQVKKLGNDKLMPFVERVVTKAKQYGIDVKRDVADYAVIALTHGIDFEEQPAYQWAREILRDPDMEGGTKLLQLETRLAEIAKIRGMA